MPLSFYDHQYPTAHQQRPQAATEKQRFKTVMDVRDGTHESPLYFPSGCPFISSKNLNNGKIDYERLITNLKLEDGLILDIKGVQAAEGALVSRYFMYPSVYQHHTTRIVNTMFRRALKKTIYEDIIDEKKMYQYDDSDIIAIFRHCENEYANDIMHRLDNRIVPKRVKTIRLDNFKFTEFRVVLNAFRVFLQNQHFYILFNHTPA